MWILIFMHTRSKFLLFLPVPINGKDKNRTAARWKTSDIVMSCHILVYLETPGSLLLKHKMQLLMVSKKKNPLFV